MPSRWRPGETRPPYTTKKLSGEALLGPASASLARFNSAEDCPSTGVSARPAAVTCERDCSLARAAINSSCCWRFCNVDDLTLRRDSSGAWSARVAVTGSATSGIGTCADVTATGATREGRAAVAAIDGADACCEGIDGRKPAGGIPNADAPPDVGGAGVKAEGGAGWTDGRNERAVDSAEGWPRPG